jgi:hypothetical protein
MAWIAKNITFVSLLRLHIQSDSGGKVNILGGESIGHCEKRVHMNMCLIVNGCRERAV